MTYIMVFFVIDIKIPIVIIRVDFLWNGEEGFYELLTNVEELENYNFIIIDTAQKLKGHEYDKWRKNYRV